MKPLNILFLNKLVTQADRITKFIITKLLI